MSTMNWVDYLILGVFFFSILAGFARGFVREVISLLTIIAAFIIASMFANTLAAAFTHAPAVQSVVSQSSSAMGLNTSQPVSYFALGMSYVILFVGTLLVGALIGSFVNAAFQSSLLGIGNRFFGAGFGLIRGFIINLVLIFLVQLSPLGDESWWLQSHFVNVFQPSVQWLQSIVSPSLASLKEKFNRSLQNINSDIQDVTGKFN